MHKDNFAKGILPVIGSVLILIGTSIGAAILALPLSSASASFPFAALILIISWAVMTITGLLMLEVSFAFPIHRNHFHTMSKATLGRVGPPIVWVSSLGLFYSLISAYISGNSSLLIRTIQNYYNIQLPPWSSACIFTLVIAVIVYFGTRGVDLFNRGLLTFKGLMLILVIISTMPHINFSNLSAHYALENPQTLIKTIIFAAPIFLTCFGFHAVIPSMINYLGPNKNKLRFVIITGTTLSLVLYLLWLASIFGLIPLTGDHSFTNIQSHGNSLDKLLTTIEGELKSKWVIWALNAFSNVALTTSCLGVSLGLFDFIADGLKRKNNFSGKIQTLAVTFLPPLFISIFYPNFFLMGLSIGAIFLVILEILIPVAMAYKFRKNKKLQSSYTVPGGNILLILITIIGALFFICDIISKFLI